MSLSQFLFDCLVMYGKIFYVKGLIDSKKSEPKKICRHGNFIYNGGCDCSTCKKGIDY